MTDPKHLLLGVLIIFCGLFSLISSLKDWNWFFEHRKARLLVHVLGRTGARIFYAVLGIIISGLGVFLLVAPEWRMPR